MTDDEIIQEAQKILRRRVRRNTVLSCPQSVREYFQMQLSGLSYEVFCVVFLDSQHRILHFEELFTGTLDGASVYPRRVVEEALNHRAAALIFCHNHPSGVSEPSAADRRITERLTSALALIDVRVLDHFIVSGEGSYSFAESGLI
jgi:DNA repair protein RadC